MSEETNVTNETTATLPLIPKDEKLRDRYQGCLLGGAVGDALGYPVEFMSRKQILAAYGEGGIRDYPGGTGLVSDDTQMTLFTAEGLLQAYYRYMDRGLCNVKSVLRRAYLRWLHTQKYETHCYQENEMGGWLIRHKELFCCRAPGNTCLSAMRKDTAVKTSKGCGGVMRVAPVGMVAGSDSRFFPRGNTADGMQWAYEMGEEAAAITHGHPTGYITAGVFAAIVALLLQGEQLRESVYKVLTLIQNKTGNEETLQAIEISLQVSKNKQNNPSISKELGLGWVAEEALAIALYAALVADESEGDNIARFEKGIVLAVNHDGDSDSTGSICGNLLGAMYGKSAIPQRWLTGLELQDIIGGVADDILTREEWFQDESCPTDSVYQFYKNRYGHLFSQPDAFEQP